MYLINTVLDVIDIYNKNKSIKRTSLVSNIPKTTVHNWITKYSNKLTNLMDRIKRTINYKIKQEFTNIELNQYVLDEIYKNPFLRRSELSEKIFKKFNIKFNINKVTKLYKFLNMTFKKPKYHSTRAPTGRALSNQLML